MSRVFISHNHNDDPFVNKLSQDLKKRGIKTFVDHQDIKLGKDWTERVAESLDECTQMVAVITDQSKVSKNCTDEWAYFMHEQKEVIPLWLNGKMYFRFAAINYVDFRTEYANALTNLVHALTDHVEHDTLTPQDTPSDQIELDPKRRPARQRQRENTTLNARLHMRYPLLRLPTKCVGIATGNIAEIVGADVLVNSENTELVMAHIQGGSVSAALNFYSAKWDEKGHLVEETIRRDLEAARRHLPPIVPLATVLPTAATGSLKNIGVRYVIHAVTVDGNRHSYYKPGTKIELGRALTNSLQQVDMLNRGFYRSTQPLRTVVFPIFGAGEGGLSLNDVAPSLIERAIDYLETHDSQIENVYFCAYAQGQLDALTGCFDAIPDLAPPRE